MSYHYLIHDFESLNPDSDWELGDENFDLDGGQHLTRNLEKLNSEGWDSIHILNPDDFAELKRILTGHIKKQLLKYQHVSDDFSLENYHTHVHSDSIHYSISSWALPHQVIEPIFKKIQEQMEALLGQPLVLKEIEHKGIIGDFLGFRIVRPGKTDHSPFHRDAWLSYWKNTVNVWIPVTGFENGNTISILPKTHKLKDSEILRTKKGAVINGKSYHVPAAIAMKEPYEQIKPVLEAGEGLIFSPYILHGNGINGLPDKTRVSIELRFCKKTQP